MEAMRGTLSDMAIDKSTYVSAPPGQDELPYDDGAPMETARHRAQMSLLIDSLAAAWSDRRDFFVGGNMFVYFSELQTKQNALAAVSPRASQHFRGPDVFVVLGTERKTRKSWVVWEEDGKLPDVVIELLSDRTEHVDRGEKMRIYAKVWRTPVYVLYDPLDHRLEGYALDAVRGEYLAIARDARGDLPVERLGLALGLRGGARHEEPGPWLRWVDPATGEALPEGAELAAMERTRAEREKARAEQEKARAEQEKARAEQEKARAEQEKARAEQEKARADAAEQRLAALEAELARARRGD
jgi:Uma2 family endonuclease